jgi:hypothetical protein
MWQRCGRDMAEQWQPPSADAGRVISCMFWRSIEGASREIPCFHASSACWRIGTWLHTLGHTTPTRLLKFPLTMVEVSVCVRADRPEASDERWAERGEVTCPCK